MPRKDDEAPVSVERATVTVSTWGQLPRATLEALRAASEYESARLAREQEAIDLQRRQVEVLEKIASGGAPAMPAPPEAPPVLIDAEEAARLCKCSVEALYQRVSRRQVPGVVRTGRRVQFHREKLLEGLEKKAARR